MGKHEAFRNLAEVLRSGVPIQRERWVLPAGDQLDAALDGAHHGIPLTTMLRSYRLAHAATAQHVNAILAPP